MQVDPELHAMARTFPNWRLDFERPDDVTTAELIRISMLLGGWRHDRKRRRWVFDPHPLHRLWPVLRGRWLLHRDGPRLIQGASK